MAEGGSCVCVPNICWVSSGTVRARYCCEPRDVSGAKPIMKQWRRGKGIMLTASLRRSQLSWPGKRSEHVVPAFGDASRTGFLLDLTAERVHGSKPRVDLASSAFRAYLGDDESAHVS